jgi:hypothetical protein
MSKNLIAKSPAGKDKNKPRRLTKKQKLFIQHIIDNPKAPLADSAEYAYNLKNRANARALASENLAKPYIRSILDSKLEKIEQTMLDVVEDWGHHEKPRQREIALQNAQYIHDKIAGKAVQKIETKSEAIVISIDLSTDSEAD